MSIKPSDTQAIFADFEAAAAPLDAVELFRLTAVVKNCGAQLLDDPQRLERFFGKAISGRERHLLEQVRRVIETGGNRAG